jgi:hypothetical protein
MIRLAKLVERIDRYLVEGGELKTLVMGGLPDEAPDEKRVFSTFDILQIDDKRPREVQGLYPRRGTKPPLR